MQPGNRATSVTSHYYQPPTKTTRYQSADVVEPLSIPIACVAVSRDTSEVVTRAGIRRKGIKGIRDGGGDIEQVPTEAINVSPWKFRSTLQLPNRSDLRRLRAAIPKINWNLYLGRGRKVDYKIHRDDIAVDIEPVNESDLYKLASRIYRSLVIRYHREYLHFGRNKTGEFYIYFGPKNARRVVVIYYDKVSKVTGRKCVHIEFRSTGAHALQGRKHQPIATLDDVENFDLIAFARREFRLAKFRDKKSFRRAVGKLIHKLAVAEYQAERAETKRVIANVALRELWIREAFKVRLGLENDDSDNPWTRTPIQLLRDVLPKSITNYHLVDIDTAGLFAVCLV